MNKPGIPRMVRTYFRELAAVIFECARALKPGAPFVMVNGNVRYQGVHVPVDLILSEVAEKAGFKVEEIGILPRRTEDPHFPRTVGQADRKSQCGIGRSV